MLWKRHCRGSGCKDIKVQTSNLFPLGWSHLLDDCNISQVDGERSSRIASTTQPIGNGRAVFDMLLFYWSSRLLRTGLATNGRSESNKTFPAVGCSFALVLLF